jgi:hypothetical protein
MPELLAALDAFLQEHRRCGELDGGGCRILATSPASKAEMELDHGPRGAQPRVGRGGRA